MAEEYHAYYHGRGPSSQGRFSLIGSKLCIDFANSIPVVPDPISCWADLVAFLVAVGILDASRADALRNPVSSEGPGVSEAFAAALKLRSGIRSVVEAIAHGQAVHAPWIEPVNSALVCTEGYDQLIPTSPEGKTWRLGFVARQRRLEWLLAAIARSTAELIAEGPGAPVRKCASPNCAVYFYDASRNGKRRWCSMSTCGNRSKVAAHARRAREART